MAVPRSYSWGNLPLVRQDVAPVRWRDEPLPLTNGSMLAWGLGRSYGDCCVNDGQTVLATRRLDRIMHFDRAAGRLRCEAGVSLGEILELAVPAGWFLPVVPGTKHVTVGGAIANDVHGKNHHRLGTFGHHVYELELLRSDIGRVVCSPEHNSDLFRATVGGLGLTGLILSAEIQLKPVTNGFIATETFKFRGLDEFRELSRASSASHEYVVAWFDCMSRQARGFLTRGNHAGPERDGATPRARPRLGVPFHFPGFVLSTPSMMVFNACVYNRQWKKRASGIAHYDPFLFPLDAIDGWNRIYGRRGFYQYQCVVPNEDYDGLKELLDTIARAGAGSFLAVLKEFGEKRSMGTLSFPREGVTLALDFPNRGERTLRLLDRLDEIVMAAGGAVYLAKDARLSPRAFAAYYPQWQAFERQMDPQFSSSLWRRVTRGRHVAA